MRAKMVEGRGKSEGGDDGREGEGEILCPTQWLRLRLRSSAGHLHCRPQAISWHACERFSVGWHPLWSVH